MLTGPPTTAAALPLELRTREYSPSSCIGGNHAPYAQIYADLSRLALERHPARRHLAYGAATTQTLYLLLPERAAGDPAPPLLVYIHGGYWQMLSKDSSLFPALAGLPEGVALAAIDYTLAPQASVHDMVLECRQALRWLHAHGEALGFDPARIVVAGSSAGAHLSAMCCLHQWPGDADLAPGLPAAAVLVSGIYELAPLIGTPVDRPLRLNAEQAAAISPQRQRLAGFPPAVVCWGGIETSEFKRQSRDFAQALEDAATPVALFEVAGRNHFDVILDLLVRDTRLGDHSLALLRRC